MEYGRWEAAPGLPKPAPPLPSKDHSRWQREKIALGPAARKAAHSQREKDPAAGSCSSTHPTGKGLLGGAARSPTPPLGSRDHSTSPSARDVIPGVFRVLRQLLPSQSADWGNPRGPRARPGELCPAAVWWVGSPLGSSSPAPGSPGSTCGGCPAHRAWERCLWKALSRNVASFSQSSSWMNP